MPVVTSQLFGNTWFRGPSADQPQAAMFNAGLARGATCFVKLERAPYREDGKPVNTYAAFSTHEAFITALAGTPADQRCYYEILRNDRPQRLYLDFDLVSDDTTTEALAKVRALRDKVNNELRALGVAEEALTVRATCGSRPKGDATKHSYHLVWPNVQFAQVDQGMKHFMNVRVGVDAGHDVCVYTMNRCMRTLLSHKYGDTQGLLAVDLETGDALSLDTTEAKLEYLISAPAQGVKPITDKDAGWVPRPKTRRPRATAAAAAAAATAPPTAAAAATAPPTAAPTAAPPAAAADDDTRQHDWLDYLADQLRLFGYRDVRWLNEYQGGWRFSWNISFPDPLGLPQQVVYHESDDHALVKWEGDEVYVSSFSERLQRKRALLCTVSGKPIAAHAQMLGWRPCTFIQLVQEGKVHQARSMTQRFCAVSHYGNTSTLLTLAWDGLTREWTQQPLTKAVTGLNGTPVDVVSPLEENKQLHTLEAALDQLQGERLGLEAERANVSDGTGADEQRAVIRKKLAKIAAKHAALSEKLEALLASAGNESKGLGELLMPMVPRYDAAVWRPDWARRDGRPAGTENMCNLFTGYAAETLEAQYPDRDPACVQPVIDHIDHVLCNSDPAMNKYVLDWLAHLCQYPSCRPGTALVFVSRQGVGKDEFKNFLTAIMGDEHVVTVMDDTSLTGGFNAHMGAKLLVVANEMGTMGAAHKASNAMKSKISDSRELLTLKGVDSRQVLAVAGLMMFTQNTNPVLVEEDDRRYCVIECNSALANQPAYFNTLRPVLRDPKVQVEFFRQLRERDITAVHFASQIPTSQLRQQLKRANRSPAAQYLEMAAEAGALPEDRYVPGGVSDLELPGRVSARELLQRVHSFMGIRLKQASRCTFYQAEHLAADVKRILGPACKVKSSGIMTYLLPSGPELAAKIEAVMATPTQLTEEEVKDHLESRKRKRPVEPEPVEVGPEPEQPDGDIQDKWPRKKCKVDESALF